MISTNIYPVRMYGDPILRKRARAVSETTYHVPGFSTVTLPELARNMLESMYVAHGVGLAAPQIGLPIRMFVAVEYDDDLPEGTPLKARVLREFVMVNPQLEILDARLAAKYPDGCLSIPQVYEDGVKRERAIRVTYHDELGTEHVIEADDYLARVLQHEYEHLDGKLFFDRLNNNFVERHRGYLSQLQREAQQYLRYLDKKAQLRK